MFAMSYKLLQRRLAQAIIVSMNSDADRKPVLETFTKSESSVYQLYKENNKTNFVVDPLGRTMLSRNITSCMADVVTPGLPNF